jgi:hypothetical protein
MAYSVFISYSTQDLATAEALRTWITAAGADSFLAKYSLEPGQPLAAELMAAIQRCDLFLLLWSQNAKSSEWVPQEIGVARGAGRTIVPVVLHPGLSLPGFINDLKYLPLYEDTMAAVEWLRSDVASRVQDKQVVIFIGLVLAILALMALLEGK